MCALIGSGTESARGQSTDVRNALLVDSNPGPRANPGTLTRAVGAHEGVGYLLTHTGELWSTNGTPAGTQRLVSAGTISAYPNLDLTKRTARWHGRLIVASGGAYSVDLATGATNTLRWPYEEANSTNYGHCIAAENGVLLRAWSLNLPAYLRTDGTREGTDTLPLSSGHSFEPDQISAWVAFSGRVFMLGAGYGNSQLWRSDGTVGGTDLVRTIEQQQLANVKWAHSLAAVNGRLIFVGPSLIDGAGFELWSSDGTSEGTGMVIDIGPGELSGLRPPLQSEARAEFAITGDRAYFLADSRPAAGFRSYYEMWVTDGTAAGTRRVFDFHSASDSFLPPQLVAAGGKVYITGASGLWVSDGTTEGTHRVSPTVPGTNVSITPVSGGVVVVSQSYTIPAYFTDGTEAGTRQLLARSQYAQQFMLGLRDGAVTLNPTVLGGEPCALDLQTGAMTPLADMSPTPDGTADGNPAGFIRLGDVVLFQSGGVLWRSGGSSQCTSALATGVTAESWAQRVRGQGRHYFGRDVDGRASLWSTDGTIEGTVMIGEYVRGPIRPRSVTDSGVVIATSAPDVSGNLDVLAFDIGNTTPRVLASTYPSSAFTSVSDGLIAKVVNSPAYVRYFPESGPSRYITVDPDVGASLADLGIVGRDIVAVVRNTLAEPQYRMDVVNIDTGARRTIAQMSRYDANIPRPASLPTSVLFNNANGYLSNDNRQVLFAGVNSVFGVGQGLMPASQPTIWQRHSESAHVGAIYFRTVPSDQAGAWVTHGVGGDERLVQPGYVDAPWLVTDDDRRLYLLGSSSINSASASVYALTLDGTRSIRLGRKDRVLGASGQFTFATLGSKVICGQQSGILGIEPVVRIPCPADVASVGGSTALDGQITADDLVAFLDCFFAGNIAIADIASRGGEVIPDGDLTADDLVVFLNSFIAGCP